MPTAAPGEGGAAAPVGTSAAAGAAAGDLSSHPVTDPGARAAAEREATRRQVLALLVLTAAAAMPVGRAERGPVVCPVRHVTGRPCPGCGLTRSFVRTAHGDLPGAARAHPAGPLLVGLGAAWALTGRRHAGTPLDPRRWTTTRRGRVALAGVAAAWLAWALVRALAG